MILLTSCTHDDPSPVTNATSQDDVLVKEMYVTQRAGAPEYNWNRKFTYNGKKINKINIGPFYPYDVVYTYTGDLITSEEWFRIGHTSSSLYQKYVYEYDINGRLETVKRIYGAPGSTLNLFKKYTYNTDGTVVENSDPSNQTTFYFNNGNIIKTVQVTPSVTTTLNYTYETTNSPFRNVVGFNKLMVLWGIDTDFFYGNPHNVKSIISSTGYELYKVDYSYKLLFNFPLKSVFSGSSNLDRQFTYN